MYRVIRLFILILALIQCAANSFGQATAPGRNWAALTQYIYSTDHQDSIFTFFGSKGNLRATHSSGLNSSYSWYKYNPNIQSLDSKFELLSTEVGVPVSVLDNLDEGGYRVVVNDNVNPNDTFTVWLFTDDVQLSRIDFDNRCDFLELNAITSPSSYNVENDRFVYYDIFRPSNHTEINTYGRGYFQSVVWQADESRVEFDQSSSLQQIIENPAPLYNSTYTVEITNIFGRKFTAQTSSINAIAVMAVQIVETESETGWAEYDEDTDYQALLGLRLESSAVNADSIYWLLSKMFISKTEDDYKVIWRDSSLLASRNESYPTKQLMRPGYFKLKHIVVNTTSGCKDSLEVSIEVDSAKISPDAIPNVFTPNRPTNKMFRFIEPEKNIKSIQHFTIKIFTRSGKQVYEYSGNPLEWEGWNGKIKGTGADVSEGVYFFIIEAKGWDGREFDYGPYKGFLHLYRGQ